jgi:hypothetical protein
MTPAKYVAGVLHCSKFASSDGSATHTDGGFGGSFAVGRTWATSVVTAPELSPVERCAVIAAANQCLHAANASISPGAMVLELTTGVVYAVCSAERLARTGESPASLPGLFSAVDESWIGVCGGCVAGCRRCHRSDQQRGRTHNRHARTSFSVPRRSLPCVFGKPLLSR